MATTCRPIDRLTVRGFRSIRALENFALSPGLNVLIGGNGSGKSNFISLFSFLSDLVNGRLGTTVRGVGGAERVLFRGSKTTQTLEAEFHFEANAYRFGLQATVDDAFMFVREEAFFINCRRSFGNGHLESQLRSSLHVITGGSWGITDFVYFSMADWKIYHFHDTSVEARRSMQRAPIQDNNTFRSRAENLAPFLLQVKIQHPEIYHLICQTIRLAIPSFDAFHFRSEETVDGQTLVQITWTELGSDYPLILAQLSDGSLRFICLTVALLQPNPPATIIIDEPELGLHPYALNLLAALFRQAAQRTQVIVSTQSPQLLDHCEPQEVIVVDKVDGATTLSRLGESQLTQWLSDYTLGEVWQKNLIGGRPNG